MTGHGFTPDQVARFRDKVDDSAGPDACWPWQGWTKEDNGYGLWAYSDHGRISAAKAAWMIAHNAPMPDDHETDHVRARGCAGGSCVNPAHLEAVTHAENMRRMAGVCRNDHPIEGDNALYPGPGRRPQCRVCTNQRRRHRYAARQENTNA